VRGVLGFVLASPQGEYQVLRAIGRWHCFGLRVPAGGMVRPVCGNMRRGERLGQRSATLSDPLFCGMICFIVRSAYGSARKSGRTKYGRERLPQHGRAGWRYQPSMVARGARDQPSTVARGARDQPGMVARGDRDQPSTVARGDRDQPSTVARGARDQPSTDARG
jgi:hypothetical protein